MGQKIGVVDLGSNSVKILVAEQSRDQNNPLGFQILGEKSWVTRLGRGIKNPGDPLNQESIHATDEALKEIQKFAAELELKPSELKAVGTAALRRCGDPQKVSDLVKLHLGISLEIISGEKEAELSFEAALFSGHAVWGKNLPFLFAEIGGASSQLGTSEFKDAVFSTPVGAVRVFESQESAASLLGKNNWTILKSKLKSKNVSRMVAVGGSLVLAAKLCPKAQPKPLLKNSTNYLLKTSDFLEFSAYLSRLSLEDRKKISGMDSLRADILPAALEILGVFLNDFHIEELLVTSAGLRHGVVAEFFLESKS